MPLLPKHLLPWLLVAAVSGCSTLKFPGVYLVVVQQGNFIEEEMVKQLEPGMSRDQVRFIMGTPMIADTFSPDRWDYYFNVRQGEKTLREYHFTVHFEGDSLARWEGNYRPEGQDLDSTVGRSVNLDPEEAAKVAPEEEMVPDL